MKPSDFLDEFIVALKIQLDADNARWGDTWQHRSPVGQEFRIYNRLSDYLDQWIHAGIPIPWLKIAGLSLIAWIRENHPEIHVQQDDNEF